MLTAAVVAVFLATSVVPVQQSGSRNQDWEITKADDGAGSLAFRAMTLEEDERSDKLVLALDRLPSDCDTVLVSMSVVGDQPHGLPGGLLSETFPGEMQVDKRAPRRFDYRFLTDPNFDNVILVQLTGWGGNGDLFREIRGGNKWRFRLSLGAETQSWRFSLTGVSTALEQTRRDCLAHSDDREESVPAQAELAEEYAL